MTAWHHPGRPRNGKEKLSFPGGVAGFVRYMNRNKTRLHPKVFYGIGEKTA